MSETAQQHEASPRRAWQARLRADIESGDALIRSFGEPPRARARETTDPGPNPPSLAGEGREGGGDDGGDAPQRFAKDQLKAFIERIERLAEEKKAIGDDIADIYREAKANGFDKKALATVVRIRAQDINERKEHEAIVETYLHALGMLT
jgi:uncharacterized protein (UPF0335 family)